MQLFGLAPRSPSISLSRDIVVKWITREKGTIKVNVDGSAFSNPSSGAIGGVFRDWQANFLVVLLSRLVMLAVWRQNFLALCMLLKSH